MSKEKWFVGTVLIILSFGLSGCAGYGPSLGSLNPFGGEEPEQKKRQQQKSTGPLVMPGEVEDQQSQEPKQQPQLKVPEEDQKRRQAEGSRNIDFGRTQPTREESMDRRPTRSGSSLIEPTINDKKRAAELADKAHKAYQQDRIRKAIKRFKRASQLDPSKPQYLINLGSLQFDRQNYEKAKKYYERALSIRPDDAQLNVFLGATHLRTGNSDLAQKWLRKALNLNPDSRTARTARNLLSQIKQ